MKLHDVIEITLHIKVQIIPIGGDGRDKIFILPGYYELEQNDAYFKVSPPVQYMFQYSRDISSDELSKVKMDIMPGFKVSWHYSCNNGTELDIGTRHISRIVPKENQELVRYLKCMQHDWGSIRSSPGYGLSTLYRLIKGQCAGLFHHVLIYMVDLQVLPALI